jgi:hypothetical protein
MIEQNSLGEQSSQSQNISAPSESVTPVSPQPAQEKMLPQSEVRAIASRESKEGYEKGYQKAMRELAEKYGSNATQQPYSQPAPVQTAASTQQPLTPEQVKQMIAEQAPQVIAQQTQQAQWAQIENQYIQKLEAGKTAYPDFDEKVKILDLGGRNRDLIPLLNFADNAADVIYDIANNPLKLSNFRRLAMEVSPQAAFNEMRNLSESIKRNQAGTQEKAPNPPLSQIKASVTGADNGSSTIADARGKYRF